MKPNNAIERALLTHQQKNQTENYFTRYVLLRDRLLNNEYTQVMSGFVGGNDHGPNHIRRVLSYLDMILAPKPLKHVRPYELFITMMAILYHDIGILRQRKDHAQISAILLALDSNDYVFDSLDKNLMEAAVVSHSSSVDIQEQCRAFSQIEHVRGNEVRPKVVAALVRLADELDEDARRADPAVEAKMNLSEPSKFYWRFNQCVRGVRPDPSSRIVYIDMKYSADDIAWCCVSDEGASTSFIWRSVGKLCKIAREIEVCSLFLPDALKFKGIELSLKPTDLPESLWTTPLTLHINGQTTVQELLSRFPSVLSGGVAASGPQFSLNGQVVDMFPNRIDLGDYSPKSVAYAIEHATSLRVQVVAYADRTIFLWVALSDNMIANAKCILTHVACLISGAKDIDRICIGVGDVDSVVHSNGTADVVDFVMEFDRASIVEAAAKRQATKEFLARTKVKLPKDQSTPFVSWVVVDFADFEPGN